MDCPECGSALDTYSVPSIFDTKRIIERGLMCLNCGCMFRKVVKSEVIMSKPSHWFKVKIAVERIKNESFKPS